MSAYRLSPRAQRQLNEIYHYSADRWGLQQADAYIRGIKDACESFGAYNVLLRPIPERPGFFLRRVASHVLIVQPQGGEFIVVAIFHKAMDPDRHLGSVTPEGG